MNHVSRFTHAMSDFVNYNKRSIDLPCGCKDLMDVLRMQGGGLIAHSKQAGASSILKVRDPLSNIEKYVQGLFQSGRRIGHLSIMALSGVPGTAAAITKTVEQKIIGAVIFQKGADRERAVHDFLSRRGLNPPIVWEAPDEVWSYQLSPLPSEPVEISRLLTEFFQVLGLKDDTPMLYIDLVYG